MERLKKQASGKRKQSCMNSSLPDDRCKVTCKTFPALLFHTGKIEYKTSEKQAHIAKLTASFHFTNTYNKVCRIKTDLYDSVSKMDWFVCILRQYRCT